VLAHWNNSPRVDMSLLSDTKKINILCIKLTIKTVRYLHQPSYMWGHLHDFIISLGDFGVIMLVKRRQLMYMYQARKVSSHLYECKCYRFCRFLQFPPLYFGTALTMLFFILLSILCRPDSVLIMERYWQGSGLFIVRLRHISVLLMIWY
jgi:hypothetical protein